MGKMLHAPSWQEYGQAGGWFEGNWLIMREMGRCKAAPKPAACRRVLEERKVGANHNIRKELKVLPLC
jgi:hypothetical protein